MVNKLFLIGRVGKDPEVIKTENNVLAKFSLATSERYKNKAGEMVEQTEWHSIVIWGKQAEIAEKYVKKGASLFIVGKVTYRSYEKDGQTKYITEVVCSEFKMLDKKESKPVDNNPLPTEPTPPTPESDDDLPF